MANIKIKIDGNVTHLFYEGVELEGVQAFALRQEGGKDAHLLVRFYVEECEVDISDGEMLKRLKKYCSPKTESSEPDIEEIADKVIGRLTQSMLEAIRSAAETQQDKKG